jgi:hypothetical protein
LIKSGIRKGVRDEEKVHGGPDLFCSAAGGGRDAERMKYRRLYITFIFVFIKALKYPQYTLGFYKIIIDNLLFPIISFESLDYSFRFIDKGEEVKNAKMKDARSSN